MTRVNIDILGISELKWTRMGEFNSDDHYYIYYRGQESLRIYGVALIVNKRDWNAVLGCNIKNSRMILVHFWSKPFNITVILILCPATDAEEAEADQFYEDLEDLLKQTPKNCSIHHRGLECKSRKLRDTCSNRQVWYWSTKWSRTKGSRILPREYTDHSKHPFSKTQKKTLHMDITTWSIPKSDWLRSLQPKMEKLYTVSKNTTWNWLWHRSSGPYSRI